MGDAAILAGLVGGTAFTGQQQRDLVGALLCQHHIDHFLGSFLADYFPLVDHLQQLANAVAGDVVAHTTELGALFKQLSGQLDTLQTQPLVVGLNVVHAQQIDEHIGGHIVRDGDHQPAQIDGRNLHAAVHQSQHAADGHTVFVLNDQLLIPGHLALLDLAEQLSHNGQLDHAGRAHGFVGIVAKTFARSQIFKVKRCMPGENRNTFKNAFLQCFHRIFLLK